MTMTQLGYAMPVTFDGRVAGPTQAAVMRPETSWTFDITQEGVVCCVRLRIGNGPDGGPLVDCYFPLSQKTQVSPGDRLDFELQVGRWS